MNRLFLFVTPKPESEAEQASLWVCRREDVMTDRLPRGTRVYDLGAAELTLPPGRELMTVGEILPMFLNNVKPVIEV
jgi:hypothetical protein